MTRNESLMGVPSGTGAFFHIPSVLAAPCLALPLILVRHLVHAYGVHEPVSTPVLQTHPVSPSPTSASPQQGLYYSRGTEPKRWGLETKA